MYWINKPYKLLAANQQNIWDFFFHKLGETLKYFLTCQEIFLLHVSVAVEFHSSLGVRAKITHLSGISDKALSWCPGHDILISLLVTTSKHHKELQVSIKHPRTNMMVVFIPSPTFFFHYTAFPLNSIFISYKIFYFFHPPPKGRYYKIEVAKRSGFVCICHKDKGNPCLSFLSWEVCLKQVDQHITSRTY